MSVILKKVVVLDQGSEIPSSQGSYKSGTSFRGGTGTGTLPTEAFMDSLGSGTDDQCHPSLSTV